MTVDRRSLLKMGLTGGLAVYGLSAGTGRVTAQSTTSMWAQYRGSPQRHGLINKSFELSAFELQGSVSEEALFDPDNIQGAVSDSQYIYLESTDGQIAAMDCEGSIEWSKQIEVDGDSPHFSPPALSSDHLIIFQRVQEEDGRVVGFSKEDGSEAWVIELDSHPPFAETSWPLLHDGILYLVIDNSRASNTETFIKAFDIENKSILWSKAYDANEFNQVLSAAPEDLVFNRRFSNRSVGNRSEGITGIEYSTGDKRWQSDITSYAHDVTTAPVVAPDRGKVYIANGVYMIRCFDIGTGRLEWTFFPRQNDEGMYIDQTSLIPAYDGEAVYFGGRAGIIYSIDAASGSLNWRTAPGHEIEAASRYGDSPTLRSPVITDNDRVFANLRNGLFALDKSSGEVVWENTSAAVSLLGVNHCGLILGGDFDGSTGFHIVGSGTVDADGTGSTQSESNESVPGFGVGSGITAIGATGYILKRWFVDNPE